MKKVLLSTSALALVAAYTSNASAAEWEVRVGGYSTQQIGFATSDVDGLVDEDFDGVDTVSDTEIFFLPSITLDNGIRFGANVQLEGNSGGDQIDESFVFISGSFGRILIGSENSAGYIMKIGAPSVSVNGHNSGTLTAFIPFSGNAGSAASGGPVATGDDTFRGTLYSTNLENRRNNDVGRITYFTPRLVGIQVGFSYARDANEDNDIQVDENNAFGNFIDIGANYVQSFGPIDVAVYGRWGITASSPDGLDNSQVYGVGGTLGFAGFTVGASFAEQNNAGTDDGQSFDVGVAYETGPWGFSFSYLHGSNVDDENAAFGLDEEVDIFVAAVNYSLAQGVDLNVFGAYVDFEEDAGDGTGFDLEGDFVATSGNDVDGFVIGTGIALSF
ncbi:MAG: porin [Pseudomonadota bacterium]